jgi:hypothetical protein
LNKARLEGVIFGTVVALTAGYFIFSPAKPTMVLEATTERAAPSSTPKKPAKQAMQGAAVIAAILVEESRKAYYATGHPCACPDDLMRNGRRCGGNSAYSRRGGATRPVDQYRSCASPPAGAWSLPTSAGTQAHGCPTLSPGTKARAKERRLQTGCTNELFALVTDG